MKIAFFKIVITFVLLSCFSCVHRTWNKETLINEIESRIGSKLFLPQNKELYSGNKDTLNFRHEVFASKVKIVSYINGGCSTCISDLKKWHQFITENFSDKKNIFLFYVHSDDFLTFININETYIHYPFPLFLDANNTFVKSNNILEKTKMLQTFLIGNDNEVILVGNPLFGEELKALYLSEIKKRLN